MKIKDIVCILLIKRNVHKIQRIDVIFRGKDKKFWTLIELYSTEKGDNITQKVLSECDKSITQFRTNKNNYFV